MPAALATRAAIVLAKKNRHGLMFDSIQDSSRFAEFDLDGNQKLDFEEFLAMQPKLVRESHSSAEIKKWFDGADANGEYGHRRLALCLGSRMPRAAPRLAAASTLPCFAYGC